MTTYIFADVEEADIGDEIILSTCILRMIKHREYKQRIMPLHKKLDEWKD